MIEKCIQTSNQTIYDREDIFKCTDFDDPISLASNFGSWLNLYFRAWNPDDDTWLDSNNHAFTTEDLLIEFIREYKTSK